MTDQLIRNVSDTARWVAYHRATESDRPDAVFRDAYARRLAGERGERIGRALHDNAWAITTRTYLFDKAVRDLVTREGVEMVVNLAAGLDSRPYRLELPASLQWVEVDLPEIVEAKQQVLSGETPHCRLEVITENLGDLGRRRSLFSKLNERSQNTAVMSEGLLLYLDEDKVTSLAADLRAQPHFRYWLVDVVSPKVLDFVNRKWRHHFEAANAVMSFAPGDWRTFYRDRGWEPASFESMSETAIKIHRAPRIMRVMRAIGKMFPRWNQKQNRDWESGVALLRPK